MWSTTHILFCVIFALFCFVLLFFYRTDLYSKLIEAHMRVMQNQKHTFLYSSIHFCMYRLYCLCCLFCSRFLCLIRVNVLMIHSPINGWFNERKHAYELRFRFLCTTQFFFFTLSLSAQHKVCVCACVIICNGNKMTTNIRAKDVNKNTQSWCAYRTRFHQFAVFFFYILY